LLEQEEALEKTAKEITKGNILERLALKSGDAEKKRTGEKRFWVKEEKTESR